MTVAPVTGPRTSPTNSGDQAWGTDFTPTFDAFAAGDLLVIIGTWESILDSTSGASGWVEQYHINATPFDIFVYTKVAAGTSDTIPTFYCADFKRYGWTTFRLPAGTFDATTPMDAFAIDTGAAFPVGASVTPTATRDHNWIRVISHGGDSGGHTIAEAGGNAGTEISDFVQPYLIWYVTRLDKTTAGATGTVGNTGFPGNTWRSLSFLIRPSTTSPVNIALSPAVAAVSARPLTITPGSTTRALNRAQVATSARPLTVSRSGDPVSIALVPAVAHVTARTLTPVGLELAADVEHNELYRREFGDNGDGIRVAPNLAAQASFRDYLVDHRRHYQYRTKAVRVDGAIRWSEWTP